MIRTTGKRSQNTRIHGNCEDIAEQLGMHKSTVYNRLLWEMADEGIITYETEWLLGKSNVVYQHESSWSTKQAADAGEILHRMVSLLVAQHKKPLFLHEYVDGKAVKVWVRP